VLRQLLHAWRENRADGNKVLIFSKSAKLLTFLELEIAKSEIVLLSTSLSADYYIMNKLIGQSTVAMLCAILMAKLRKKIVRVFSSGSFRGVSSSPED
jgi:hypothetical protein